MDSLIVFKGTGEVRCPNKGEWFQDRDGQMLLARSYLAFAYPIYERIEISIPEGAEEFRYYFPKHAAQSIPLSRKKVKKYQWQAAIGSIDVITQEYYQNAPNGYNWIKIQGSEIEIEE